MGFFRKCSMFHQSIPLNLRKQSAGFLKMFSVKTCIKIFHYETNFFLLKELKKNQLLDCSMLFFTTIKNRSARTLSHFLNKNILINKRFAIKGVCKIWLVQSN